MRSGAVASGFLLVFIPLAGCVSLPRDYAYRDLASAGAELEHADPEVDSVAYVPPSPADYDALRRKLDDAKYLWCYEGTDNVAAIPLPPAKKQTGATSDRGDATAAQSGAARVTWPLRIAVVTYEPNADYCNTSSGAEECLVLTDQFANLPAVLAAHGLYWDMHRSGRFAAVHFQPDSVADYDAVFHVNSRSSGGLLELTLSWRGELTGSASARVYDDDEETFVQLMARDPEKSHKKLCGAIGSLSRSAAGALAAWVGSRTPEEIAIVRARHTVEYFKYFDEHFEELNQLLESAATPEDIASAQEEIDKRRIVLQTSQGIERRMCYAASTGKRDYLMTQIQAKEPIDRELASFQEDYKKNKRRQHLAEFAMVMNSVAAEINSYQNNDPYAQQQAEILNAQLMAIAEAARQQANEIRSQQVQFAAEFMPQLEAVFIDSPYAEFLREFFETVDFSSVQRMRVTTRETYLRTFAEMEPEVVEEASESE